MPERLRSMVLVVDDDDAMRYAVARALRSGGHEVIEASTGEGALEGVQQHPDLVVLDLKLPDIDGREVCRRIKADPDSSSVPVLHLTSIFRKPEDRASALEDGADGFLTHPVEPIELLATVKAMLRLAKAEKQARNSASDVIRLNADLEKKVRDRTAKLEEAVREMEAFSYSVSHDLRAPLRAIDGFSSMLERHDGAVLSVEGRRLLGTIRANTVKMSHLIDDLLSLAGVGRTSKETARVDMGALARAAMEAAVPNVEARSRISFEVGPLPDALGDASLLAIVWSNLLGNAVKFTSGRERPRIRISGEIDGDHAIYRVSDNGAGFDMAYKQKLFGVFQRLHGVKEFEGTGIGLAIVHRIVRRHGGEVSATGVVGEGAIFTFSLPTTLAACGEQDREGRG